MTDRQTLPNNLFRHVKTGRAYEVVCTANMEDTQREVVVYRDVLSGKVWVRPHSEFTDGRFRHMGYAEAPCTS